MAAVGVIARPEDMFDRAWEWDALVRFCTADPAGATLGVVSGRRRQGKSYLLEALCAALGGFYFAATEATEAESLRQLAEALADHLDMPAAPVLRDWEQAVDLLLALGREAPAPVVLDEFPYLCASSPALPSIVQKALGPRRAQRVASRARLVLCGSAMTFMGGLLSGSAPLRGRAGLDLTVPTFDYRQAAEFWGIDDPHLAVRVHAVVGGTPAYRREYVSGDVPDGADDFDPWMLRTVLNPASPLFKEARYLLTEEPSLRDKALYHSVLAAVAEGNQTRGGIARFVGRRDDALSHPLTVLADAGLLRHDQDAFRTGRPTMRITEPLITFYHAVMRPDWARLERPGQAGRVWTQARTRFDSAVLGPHFEELCRSWAAHFADDATLGGAGAAVSSGIVNDPAGRRSWEVDVAVRSADGALLALGEAKWGQTMGMEHLRRLQRIRQLLITQNRNGAEQARLLCFSGAGFTDELRTAERAGAAVCIDLDRLYGGA
ncbi:MAG: AAA family ATPase [Pseudonocardiaceae bacterium]